MMGPAGAPNESQLIIHNYFKFQGSMTLVFDKAQKDILRVQIASYMDDPKDAMNLMVQFSRRMEKPRLQSGDRRVSKPLNIAIQANYQHVLSVTGRDVFPGFSHGNFCYFLRFLPVLASSFPHVLLCGGGIGYMPV